MKMKMNLLWLGLMLMLLTPLVACQTEDDTTATEETPTIAEIEADSPDDTSAENTEMPTSETTITIPPGAGPGHPPANWPENIAISYEQAVEIALSYVSGNLIEVDHDFEHGHTVWYVAIRADGFIHEIYVDVMSGEIIYHESEIDD